ncbi:MAG: hypothetical protein WD555_00125 [Fulvivirga sp.]
MQLPWENSLGAGLTWNFHKNFSLNSRFGLGYHISSLKHDDLDEQPVLSNRDYRGYRNKGIFYNIQIGTALRWDN